MSFDPQTPPQPSPPTIAPSQDAAIILQDVSKVFEIYDRPVHRLLQMLCRGRRRFYRSFEALHHIDLTIHKGECVGIVGRNGARQEHSFADHRRDSGPHDRQCQDVRTGRRSAGAGQRLQP